MTSSKEENGNQLTSGAKVRDKGDNDGKKLRDEAIASSDIGESIDAATAGAILAGHGHAGDSIVQGAVDQVQGRSDIGEELVVVDSLSRTLETLGGLGLLGIGSEDIVFGVC